MSKRPVWGILLIAVGLLFLLQSAGIYTIGTGISFWPVVLTLVGLFITYSSFYTQRRQGTNWFGLALGLWLGAMGLFDILSDAGITPGLDGGRIASSGWPILLIAIGLHAVTDRPKRSGSQTTDGPSPTNQMVGDMRFGQEPWVLDGDLSFNNSVGDLKVDLTTAQITPGTHRITVTQFMGETVIRLPEDVTVRVTAEANVGELDILGEERGGIGLYLQQEVVVPGSLAELTIEAVQRVGSLRVVRVPAPRRVI